MKQLPYFCSIPLLLALGFISPICANSSSCADSSSVTSCAAEILISTEQLFPLLAAPRWWDETVAWIRSIGWDRGRLVQLWLFFMLVGLYIIVRIKPRG